MVTFWTKGGKILKDVVGKIIDCATCPCDTVPIDCLVCTDAPATFNVTVTGVSTSPQSGCEDYNGLYVCPHVEDRLDESFWESAPFLDPFHGSVNMVIGVRITKLSFPVGDCQARVYLLAASLDRGAVCAVPSPNTPDVDGISHVLQFDSGDWNCVDSIVIPFDCVQNPVGGARCSTNWDTPGATVTIAGV